MSVKRIVVINLVVSSLALVASGAALGVNCIGQSEPVVCECKVEETTEPVVEVVDVVETTEVTAVTEVTEPIESTDVTEPTEVTESVTINNLGKFLLTAYCACPQCCGEYANGITATGTVATAGRTIAVDPTVIPYGTEVIIDGHTYVAEDCGGAIKNNRIDIYFDTHSEALEFGVKYADIYVRS